MSWFMFIICLLHITKASLCLQANEGTVGLQEDWMLGHRAELGAALLEAMQCYQGQAELLTEIQTLRSR